MTSAQQIQLRAHNRIWLFLLMLYVVTFYMLFFHKLQNKTSIFPDFASFEMFQYDYLEEKWPQPMALTLSAKEEEELKLALDNAQNEEFNIVVWEPPFGNRFDPSHTDAKECGKCFVTLDKTKVHDNKTKAVVFHFNEASMSNIPTGRRPDQLYIWFTMESSSALLQLRQMNLKEFDNFFNLTATYRRDSDIYWPYTTAENIWHNVRYGGSGDQEKDIDAILSGKTGLALWIVSNCGITGGAVKRMDLVNKLIDAGLKLDRRGRCFPSNGPVDNMDIIRKYKFYLSFENGYHCVDYVTEKLFYNGYVMGAVPVVWGAKKLDYIAILPPYSCIFAEDFDTPSHLVEYLKYLDKNSTAYREYFLWRTKNVTEMLQYGRKTGHCQICRTLHGINIDNKFNPNYETMKTYIPTYGYPNKPRIVPSLGKWFYGNENPECFHQQASLQTYLSSFGLR